MIFSTITCKENTAPHNNLILDIPGGSLQNIAVQQFPRNGSFGSWNQQWLFYGVDSSTVFVSRATGQALGAPTTNTAIIQKPYPSDLGLGQRWYPSPQPDRSFMFYSALGPGFGGVTGGLVMDLPLPQGRNAVHTIQIYQANGGPNQKWIVAERNISVFAFVSRANRKVLDVPGFTRADTATINQYAYGGGTNQLWEFVRSDRTFLTDATGDDSDGQPQVGLQCFIRSVSSGKVLQFEHNNSRDLAPLQQSSWNGGPNQEWGIEAGRNSSFKIRNIATGKYLVGPDDVTDGSAVIQRAAGASQNGASEEWWPKLVTFLYQPGVASI